MTLLTQITPSLPGYGLAIWNSTGQLVTGFDSSSTVLREVYRSAFSGPENGTIYLSGVPAGINSTNSIVITTYNDGSGWAQTNVGYYWDGQVRIKPTGTTTTTRSGVVSVQQYRGATPLVGTYGLQVINGDNDIVLDPGAAVWSVKYVGTLPSMASWTQYGTDRPYPAASFDEYAQWYVLNLTASTYLTSRPFAVAVKCNHDVYIIQPYIFANAAGYYTQVVFHAPMFDPGVMDPIYSYAILVSPYDHVPNEYGSDYGMELYDGTGYKFWSSQWKQGIIQKLININVFSDGTTQNGTYDHETGSDGVEAPDFPNDDELPYAPHRHASQGEAVTRSCNIDPLNTYVMFWAGNGKVTYNRCDTADGVMGGGQHWPAVKIYGNGIAVDVKMHRTARGPTGTFGARVATSFHPTGYIGLVRIISA